MSRTDSSAATGQQRRTRDAELAVRRACAGHLSVAAVDAMCWRIRRIVEPDIEPPPYDAAAQQRYARRP